MDKYIEFFCKQNPKFKLPCGNPDCGKESTFDSKDVFKSSAFEFACSSCGKSTSVDSGKIANDLITQLKSAGIEVH